MTDILKQLPNAQWRGLGFPCAGREYGFRHEQARHRYIFVDDELVESIGPENPSYTYRIPAREDLAKGPYKNWYTTVYQSFLNACRDRSVGVLFDPVHGEVQAKCVSLRETLDVGRRDGVDVEVEFIYAPEEVGSATADITLTSVAGAKGMAGAFDREVEKIDWQQEPPPKPTLDLFDAVRGIGDQIDLANRRYASQMDNLASKMEATNTRLASLGRPDVEPLRRNARKLALVAHRQHDAAVKPPEQTRIVVLTRDMGVIAAAALYGMAVGEFRAMNPTLGRGPTIKAGTVVRVKRAA
jgi:prophage DNA circulation protein